MDTRRSLVWLYSGLAGLVIATPAIAQWTNSTSKDEMTGERSCYVHSKSTRPTEKMGFPYGDTTAWMGIGSDGESEWVYVRFSDSPNLLDTSIEDGYNLIETRIKWDDKVEDVTFVQEWGAEALHFRDDASAIARIMKSNSVLLELNWYGEGKVYFRFSLQGSSAGIAKMRRDCGGS